MRVTLWLIAGALVIAFADVGWRTFAKWWSKTVAAARYRAWRDE